MSVHSDVPPVYVINLDKNQDDRLPSVKKNLREGGFSNIVRIPAVYGKSLPEEELQGKLTNRAYKAIYSKLRTNHDEMASKSAVGAYLSHHKAWEKIASSNDDFAFIAEDDVAPLKGEALRDNIVQFLRRNPNVDFVAIQYACTPGTTCATTKQNLIQNADVIIEPSSRYWGGLMFYALSKNGAKKLLEKALPADEVVDRYVAHKENFQKYEITPNTGEANLFPSTIDKSSIVIDKPVLILLIVILLLIIIFLSLKIYSMFKRKK